jgi:2-desacetyl-2-hydroxyethyl bacteriochlorophyllide A dehydrogenase
MRAAVLASPGRAVTREVPPPEPGPTQVRVRIEGAGICASELPLWEGREWFDYPREPGEPGHEGWGRVDALGEGVSGFERGQRVAVISHRAHAEFDLADASAVIALPGAIPAEQPFPGEPLGCAMNALARAGVEPGQRVAVIGVGFLGALLVELCASRGAETTAVSRRRSSLEAAERMGAARSWRIGDPALEREQPFDVVFEATGIQGPLDLASRLTRVRGRLVIAGYHQDGRRSVDMRLWNWRGIDVVNAHERDPAAYARGTRAAVEAVVAGRLDPAPLVTHSFPLEEIDEAYRVSSERPEGFMKAVWRSG